MNKSNYHSLLEHVSLIKNKFDDLAEYSGENFNVFNVLGLYSDELSHSKIIGNLLNPKAKHGQKDIFLKLFIDELNTEFEDFFTELKLPETSKSKVIIEQYIGGVNYDLGEGGRIDILIKEGKNNIVIENKIWAGDQHQQLVRYYNAFESPPLILYLTLYGDEPNEKSKGPLKNGEHFICISYERHIVNWFKNCIKEMAQKPVIRETLIQYLNLIKQLTQQASNNNMENEIVDLILKTENNLQAAKSIFENFKVARKKLVEKFLVDLKSKIIEQLKDQDFEITMDDDIEKAYTGLRIKHNNWDERICIKLEGQSRISENLTIYGIVSNREKFDRSKIKSLLDNFEFIKRTLKRESAVWPYYDTILEFNKDEHFQKLFDEEMRQELINEVSLKMIELALISKDPLIMLSQDTNH